MSIVIPTNCNMSATEYNYFRTNWSCVFISNDLTRIELKNNDNVKDIPFPDFHLLPNIESILITGQYFSVIPDLTYLPNLRSLNINFLSTSINKTETMQLCIKEIGKLPKSITFLRICGIFVDIYFDFEYLENLRDLMLYCGYCNCICELKEWIKLPISIQTLELNRINLQTIPDLSYLINLHSLTIMNCRTEIIENLPSSLTSLCIYKNRISMLPELPYRLSMLELENNNIELLPDLSNYNIRYLKIEDNPIVKVDGVSDLLKDFKNKKITFSECCNQFIELGVMHYNNDFVLK